MDEELEIKMEPEFITGDLNADTAEILNQRIRIQMRKAEEEESAVEDDFAEEMSAISAPASQQQNCLDVSEENVHGAWTVDKELCIKQEIAAFHVEACIMEDAETETKEAHSRFKEEVSDYGHLPGSDTSPSDTYSCELVQHRGTTIPKRSHQEKERYVCNDCGNSFPSLGHLKIHERIHSGTKPFSCDKCGKSFTQSGHLIRHKLTHYDEKPHTCAECGVSFYEISNLKVHERIHTGARPYTCTECGKSFSQAGNFKKHQRIHTGAKPYTCIDCGKSFSQANNLKVHRRVHTGVKPYTCDECGKSFTQKVCLSKHFRIHTRVKETS